MKLPRYHENMKMKKSLIIPFFAIVIFAKGQCYSISSVPYSPTSFVGTSVSLGDDDFSPMIPVGFSFCFYGASYDSLTIFSNGVVSFSSLYANKTMNGYGQPHAILPNIYSGTSPKNCIMFPWQDLNPSLGGTITYSLMGSPPSRIFIISFDNVPMDSCSKLFNGQVKLFEATNIIETHIANKDTCLNWGGFATHGLHGPVVNISTSGVFVSGRNYPSQWTALNEGVRFTPTCNVCAGLSVNAINYTANVSIYPNPFSLQTILEIKNSLVKGTLNIYDSQGQLVRQMENIAGRNIALFRGDLSGGLYLFRLFEGNELVYSSKMVVVDE